MHRPVQHLKDTWEATVRMRIDGKDNSARHQARLWHTRSSSFRYTHSSTVSVAEHPVHRHLGSSTYYACFVRTMLRAASSGRRSASTSARDSISLPVTSSMSLPWMDLISTWTTQRSEPYPSGKSIWRAASRRGSSTWWRVSLSLSHFFLRIYFLELFIKSSFLIVLVQTLRILLPHFHISLL